MIVDTAMILAAGRGERMRPLTDSCPKPLLSVGGHSLISYHIKNLAKVGIKNIIINHAWLGEKIQQHVGNGQQYGVDIYYSAEPAKGLETAGGIMQALPLLGSKPFIVVNGDIWTDYPFNSLMRLSLQDNLGYIVLVDNPAHHPQGDFGLTAQQVIVPQKTAFTFSGIALYTQEFFVHYGKEETEDKIALAPLLRKAIANKRLGGEYYAGQWYDIGAPERLRYLDQQLLSGL